MKCVLLILATCFSASYALSQNSSLSFNRTLLASEIKSSDEFVVQLEINKNEPIEGIVRLVENIPSEYHAEMVEANGAQFKFENGQAKFLWLAFPSEDNFKVSYLIKRNSVPVITGSFAFVKSDQKITIDIPGTEL